MDMRINGLGTSLFASGVELASGGLPAEGPGAVGDW